MGKTDQALKQAKALQAVRAEVGGGLRPRGRRAFRVEAVAAAEKAYRDGLQARTGVRRRRRSSCTASCWPSGKKAEADALARKWVADHPKDVDVPHLPRRAGAAHARHQGRGRALRGRRSPSNRTTRWRSTILPGPWASSAMPRAIGYAERALKIAPEQRRRARHARHAADRQGRCGQGRRVSRHAPCSSRPSGTRFASTTPRPC